MTDITKPGLRRLENPSEVWDDLRVKKLDKFQLVQNIFLEYHGSENEDEVTIMPITLSMNFFLGLKPGMGSINGPHQEIAWKWDGPI